MRIIVSPADSCLSDNAAKLTAFFIVARPSRLISEPTHSDFQSRAVAEIVDRFAEAYFHNHAADKREGGQQYCPSDDPISHFRKSPISEIHWNCISRDL
jgi:hypothetical protein